jgi:hypothetical protein
MERHPLQAAEPGKGTCTYTIYLLNSFLHSIQLHYKTDLQSEIQHLPPKIIKYPRYEDGNSDGKFGSRNATKILVGTNPISQKKIKSDSDSDSIRLRLRVRYLHKFQIRLRLRLRYLQKFQIRLRLQVRPENGVKSVSNSIRPESFQLCVSHCLRGFCSP